MPKTDCAIAPKDGYNTREKQLYRKQVWNALLPAWEMSKSDDRAHVLLMPSREGLEIDHVISLGIPEDRIIAIDRSAAVIATSIWRKKYPKVKFFASEIGDCHKKLAKSNLVICAANLDFCTNFSNQLIEQFTSFTENIPRFGHCRFAVTVAKGREGSAIVALLNTQKGGFPCVEEKRIAALLSCAGNHTNWGDAIIWGQGDYTSGKVPMAWAVVSRDYITKEWKKSHLEMLENIDIHKHASLFASEYKNPTKGLSRKCESYFVERIIEPDLGRLDELQKGLVFVSGEPPELRIKKHSLIMKAGEDAQSRIINHYIARHDKFTP